MSFSPTILSRGQPGGGVPTALCPKRRLVLSCKLLDGSLSVSKSHTIRYNTFCIHFPYICLWSKHCSSSEFDSKWVSYMFLDHFNEHECLLMSSFWTIPVIKILAASQHISTKQLVSSGVWTARQWLNNFPIRLSITYRDLGRENATVFPMFHGGTCFAPHQCLHMSHQRAWG